MFYMPYLEGRVFHSLGSATVAKELSSVYFKKLLNHLDKWKIPLVEVNVSAIVDMVWAKVRSRCDKVCWLATPLSRYQTFGG